MEKRRVKRVPIIEGRQLVGIVSRADLVHALVRSLDAERAAKAGTDATDTGIRNRILAVIEKEPWGPRSTTRVMVTRGVVQLDGTVTDERERKALVVAAENVPGVKEVSDRLVWVDPASGIVIPSEAEAD
jgi:osmotically-inducible protein OsmY